MKKKIKFWVGVRKGVFQDHDVIECDLPTEKTHPQYDYVIGPYRNKEEAAKRSKTEQNRTGMFTDPFCNDGEGR